VIEPRLIPGLSIQSGRLDVDVLRGIVVGNAAIIDSSLLKRKRAAKEIATRPEAL